MNTLQFFFYFPWAVEKYGGFSEKIETWHYYEHILVSILPKKNKLQKSAQTLAKGAIGIERELYIP